MKRLGLFLLAEVFLVLAGAAQLQAGTLIVNGSFEAPSVGPGYSFDSNGQVPGWYTTDSQLVSGLAVGQSYDLSSDYGVRPGSGPQQMPVWFGGSEVTLESANYNNSSLLWFPQNYTVTATSASEVLGFVDLPDSGLTSYGNEIDEVALAPTPEPSSLLLLGTGLAVLALIWGFGARLAAPSTL